MKLLSKVGLGQLLFSGNAVAALYNYEKHADLARDHFAEIKAGHRRGWRRAQQPAPRQVRKPA
jgi:hypothetical protein